jgi:C4-dicarboxylate-binding protein DctP
VSILDIPFLYPADPDAAQAIRSGPLGEALLASFADKGVVAVALWPNGAKNFTSNDALGEVGDFANQKFRVMDSRILIEQFNAVGATATAIPFAELYTALQTGVVDGQENPLDTIRNMKFYEVQKNLLLSDHGAMEDVILFNAAWWNDLPQEYREIIADAFVEIVPKLRAHKTAAVAAALDEIRASGMNVQEMTAEQRAALRAVMYPAARAAYLERAGEEGEALIAAYEAALAAN